MATLRRLPVGVQDFESLINDGYHFHWNAAGMYNPYSLLLTLAKQKFGSYWFETGTPSYLVELL